MTGLQYRYVGIIGVGDRDKKTDWKKPTSKSRTSESRFFVGKNLEKPTEKNDFRFSVHNPVRTAVVVVIDARNEVPGTSY